jgi:tetratricopeptide (TPR) repeat protein
LALEENRPDAARSHFANAVGRQSNDPVAIYNSARLQRRSGASADQVLPLLERAVALNPDYETARIDLGFTAAQANRFDLAVSTLSQLKSLQPNLAFEVLFTIAYCDLHLQRFQDAAAYAAAALQHARNSDQQNRADTLTRVIDRGQISTNHR